jgi:meso-butanediol dehydrogenase / (S,S)-butanediol dehydrogenase / diacetyl reductase
MEIKSRPAELQFQGYHDANSWIVCRVRIHLKVGSNIEYGASLEENLSFSGKRILITGAIAGIGRAAAELFSSAGATVAMCGSSRESLEAAGREMRAGMIAVSGDTSTELGCASVIDAAVAALGGLDCLVNNTAVAPRLNMEAITEAHWDEVFAVNLRSAMFCSKYSLEPLRRSRGCIVNVASMAALMAGPPDLMAYSVSMAGLIGLTRTLSNELAPHGVRVNCVCPGFIDGEVVGVGAERMSELVPIGRAGSAAEVASSILYFASEQAAYCSGSVLAIDGGCLSNLSWNLRSSHGGTS